MSYPMEGCHLLRPRLRTVSHLHKKILHVKHISYLRQVNVKILFI